MKLIPIAIAAAAAVAIAGCGSAGHPAASYTPVPAPTYTVPAAPVVTYTPPPPSPLQAWWDNGGSTDWSTVTSDLCTLKADGTAGDTASMELDAGTLRTDALAAAKDHAPFSADKHAYDFGAMGGLAFAAVEIQYGNFTKATAMLNTSDADVTRFVTEAQAEGLTVSARDADMRKRISEIAVVVFVLAMGIFAVVTDANMSRLQRTVNAQGQQIAQLETRTTRAAQHEAQAVAVLRARLDSSPATSLACTNAPYLACIDMHASGKPVVGMQITDAPGTMGGWDTPWQVTDYTGAPMAWVNLFGLYSGGDGGLEPGGLICATYGTTATVACLTPTGTLTLIPTGRHGPTGSAETLTATDIAWIHSHGG